MKPPKPRHQPIDEHELVHGGPNAIELERLGIDPAVILDFSTNLNPFREPSPRLARTLADVPIQRLPDPDAIRCRQALAEKLGIDRERIVAGNGSSELIRSAAQAYLRPGDRALIFEPTYGEYVRAVRLTGAEPIRSFARPDADFRFDLDEMIPAIERLRPRVVFICNPNNPTGRSLPLAAVRGLSQSAENVLIVVDESYWEFGPREESAIDLNAENVLVLRSLSKAYGLAGLRLGFGVGSKEVVGALKSIAAPWSVNAPAQAAGIAAIGEDELLERSLADLARETARMIAALKPRVPSIVPSSTHFFLIRTGDGAATRSALLRRGILTRDCASFGLPEYIRISTRKPFENDRLIAALAEILSR